MDFMSTVQGSLLEGFYPKGWDMARIDACASQPASSVLDRQKDWNRDFRPVPCENIFDFDMMMGHEIAHTIRKAREDGVELAMILPVGPMGMYRWAVYFLTEWNVSCSHVWGFNMDEWADGEGNTLPASDPAGFQNAMLGAFYGPLGKLTVPESHRNFATKENALAGRHHADYATEKDDSTWSSFYDANKPMLCSSCAMTADDGAMSCGTLSPLHWPLTPATRST